MIQLASDGSRQFAKILSVCERIEPPKRNRSHIHATTPLYTERESMQQLVFL